ncbi:hypothetical protein OY671_010425, partial [Metschnikowia pulcherrima]
VGKSERSRHRARKRAGHVHRAGSAGVAHAGRTRRADARKSARYARSGSIAGDRQPAAGRHGRRRSRLSPERAGGPAGPAHPPPSRLARPAARRAASRGRGGGPREPASGNGRPLFRHGPACRSRHAGPDGGQFRPYPRICRCAWRAAHSDRPRLSRSARTRREIQRGGRGCLARAAD